MMDYRYLFPFEKIEKNSEVVIYGAGELGQEYLKQIKLTQYCSVKCFIDRAYKNIKSLIVPVYGKEKIKDLEFDYIVLAFQSSTYIDDILEYLKKEKIDRKKIVFTGLRSNAGDIYLQNTVTDVKNDFSFLDMENISIAMRLGSGFGDCIIVKRFFAELIKLFPTAKIDIYAPNVSKFIESIYSDEENVNNIIDDTNLYRTFYMKYDIAFDLVTIFNIDFFNEKSLKFSPSSKKIIKDSIQKCLEYRLTTFPAPNRYVHFGRMIFAGLNCYTAYNYFGLVNIEDKYVKIPLHKEWEALFRELSLGKYITINYGNGAGQNISKQWPYEYFCELINLLKLEYPYLQIIQVGSGECKQVKNVDRYFLGENLELVKFILKESILHIDIEGGLVHLATQLKTKCAVMFGPTPFEYYGYRENINFIPSNCTGCLALYDNVYRCARGLKKPACMYSITPQIVVDKLKKYLEKYWENDIKNE